ncbi:hypothetical protein NDU88_004029 [Pleurodeles waltl]|uniref:Uncharacterized protein n=1 Tax=Pleurodeles waltl TaxID=8319 RepID=A0AAV7LGX4_PLEWA|nr:hypothetical protein NDU88_004029 [Pleurodeles waltl]
MGRPAGPWPSRVPRRSRSHAPASESAVRLRRSPGSSASDSPAIPRGNRTGLPHCCARTAYSLAGPIQLSVRGADCALFLLTR